MLKRVGGGRRQHLPLQGTRYTHTHTHTHTYIKDIFQRRSSILNVGTLPESYPAGRPRQAREGK